MSKVWKRGRGKLGFLQPLLGRWTAEVDSPVGPLRCRRVFSEVLGNSYVRVDTRWELSASAKARMKGAGDAFLKGRHPYEEIALIGSGGGKEVSFWSFTSDGKASQGTVTDATDIHPEAIGFVAKMTAGIARMAYWPDGEYGFHWAVESKTAKGWRRFTEHHYRPDERVDP